MFSASIQTFVKRVFSIINIVLCIIASTINFIFIDKSIAFSHAKSETPSCVSTDSVYLTSNIDQKKLGILTKYSNEYAPSSINYERKYPREFNMLYDLLKNTFRRKDVEHIINKTPSQLDEMHLNKIRLLAAPNSLVQQRQQHMDHLPILVNDATIEEGIESFDKYKETIMRAYSIYNVKPEDIIAVINWESGFGKYKGDYSIYKIFVGSLFNISEVEKHLYANGEYEKKDSMPRDEALKRIELLKKRAAINLAALLKLSTERNFNPYEMKGSWAGAIGIPQFMPSSMIFAADGDGDAKIDLDNMNDAIFSVAKFLHEHSYTSKGSQYALHEYNPEEMYVKGVTLYSSRLTEKGLSY